jgi:hypothetical protein
MQTMENYSDRRRNERRHDSRRINPRSGFPRRSNPRRSDARRSDARLNRSFKASVLDYDGETVNFYAGKTVNFSARGAYLEVITNDKEVFPPGTTIPLQMNAVTNTPDGREKKIKLIGRGPVIWNCVIGHLDHADSLGVALEFTEKLHTELDYD